MRSPLPPQKPLHPQPKDDRTSDRLPITSDRKLRDPSEPDNQVLLNIEQRAQ